MTSNNREWLTPADEYVCTLSEETQQIARDELREEEATRAQALASLREWIIQNPKITNCRLGTFFCIEFDIVLYFV